jgi:hypothetical protein
VEVSVGGGGVAAATPRWIIACWGGVAVTFTTIIVGTGVCGATGVCSGGAGTRINPIVERIVKMIPKTTSAAALQEDRGVSPMQRIITAWERRGKKTHNGLHVSRRAHRIAILIDATTTGRESAARACESALCCYGIAFHRWVPRPS